MKNKIFELYKPNSLREFLDFHKNNPDENFVYVLHDPCDIRKPYSSDSEHLGTVLSLQKTVVPGYSSFNSVAVITGSGSAGNTITGVDLMQP